MCGSTFIIAPKFSASSFFHQAGQANATIIQYIGELARYLVVSPPNPYDKKHRVRLAIGNGMAAGVWEAFRERFGIEEIGEFYASTEGKEKRRILVNFNCLKMEVFG